MSGRRQRTIATAVELEGIALFSAADVSLRFLPARPGHGIAFRRTDLPRAAPVPATIDHAVDRHRRTAVSNGEATVEMTEHVLAALAGLGVDNCLVEIDGPECPGFDGSSGPIVDAILDAVIVEQNRPATVFEVVEPTVVTSSDGTAEVRVEPADSFVIAYELDYGPNAPFPPQSLELNVTPENFAFDLAGARTFVLEAEIEALRAHGYGARTTTRDLLVFRENGPIDNELRWPDECVRHKLLDCVGDFALLGARPLGRFTARRSGHQLNRDLVRKLIGRIGDSHTRGVLREAA